jgi:hypothetical protein
MKHSKVNLERIRKNMEEDSRAVVRLGSTGNKNASATSQRKISPHQVSFQSTSVGVQSGVGFARLKSVNGGEVKDITTG